MNGDDILTKTVRGAEALRTRSADLPQRLRTALILVDGQHSVAALRSAASQAGAPPESLETLLELGLVQVHVHANSQAQAAPIAALSAPAPAPAVSAPEPSALSVPERCSLASKAMNEAVVDAVGLRAFFMTLKIEKCATPADLLAVLPEVMRASADSAPRGATCAAFPACRTPTTSSAAGLGGPRALLAGCRCWPTMVRCLLHATARPGPPSGG